MLPQANRIKNKKDIDNVFEKGKGFKENFLVVKLVQNSLGKIRFAFIVSKKISQKAVLRNKIRRQLSEIVRLKLKKIKIGYDIILIASPGLETKNFQEIEEIWKEVEAEIYPAISKMEVRAVHGDKNIAGLTHHNISPLDYFSSEQQGKFISVIAVGGNKLSRGLTLEGLTVSYYLRATKMYDTLMQMGRWFRPRQHVLILMFA